MTLGAELAVTLGLRPQWSPLVVSGMTLRPVHDADAVERAAMEPARGERDDAEMSPERS